MAKDLLDKWDTQQGKRLRLRCFQRDKERDAPCMWCGGSIDYSKGPYRRGGDVWAWSPEHIRPRSKWPELALDPANIGAAHFRCNASRQDRAGLTNLGSNSRRW